MRTILYLSGTRADFGLMLPTLRAIASEPGLSIKVAVTGMHLSERYGATVSEIESSGLPICARLPVGVEQATGLGMAKAFGQVAVGVAAVLASERPDVLLVLGDRGEMLAGAVAAVCQNIPVVHVCGGELSGTVDESTRHAISKFAHYHFVATEGSRRRLIAMGERADRIFLVGSPGLDGLRELASYPRDVLAREAGFDPLRPIALLVFHPVVQQESVAGRQAQETLKAVLDQGLQVICLLPNSDAGGDAIRAAYSEYEGHAKVRLYTHLSRPLFTSWMAAAEVMVGNSSSGIIEAASFYTPVVNVGDRQHGRERNANTIDAEASYDAVASALASAEALGKRPIDNLYGDGRTSTRVTKLLSELALDAALLLKHNTY